MINATKINAINKVNVETTEIDNPIQTDTARTLIDKTINTTATVKIIACAKITTSNPAHPTTTATTATVNKTQIQSAEKRRNAAKKKICALFVGSLVIVQMSAPKSQKTSYSNETLRLV